MLSTWASGKVPSMITKKKCDTEGVVTKWSFFSDPKKRRRVPCVRTRYQLPFHPVSCNACIQDPTQSPLKKKVWSLKLSLQCRTHTSDIWRAYLFAGIYFRFPTGLYNSSLSDCINSNKDIFVLLAHIFCVPEEEGLHDLAQMSICWQFTYPFSPAIPIHYCPSDPHFPSCIISPRGLTEVHILIQEARSGVWDSVLLPKSQADADDTGLRTTLWVARTRSVHDI